MSCFLSRNGGGKDWQDSRECRGSEWDIEIIEHADDELTNKNLENNVLENKPHPRPKQHHRPRHCSVPRPCPVCSVTIKSKCALTTHLRIHLPVDEGWEAIKEAIGSFEAKYGKKYTRTMGWCDRCQKFCPNLKQHLRDIHKPRRKTLCVQCGMVVRHAKIHQLTHLDVDESDYVQCPKCPSRFKHKHLLQAHSQSVHNKCESTFKCCTCGKAFMKLHQLKRHEVIHKIVKPYPCSVCDLSFTQLGNLKIHMRQHTGDKPYVCELCKEAFTNRVSLKNHRKKLHGIDWWKEKESLNKNEPSVSEETQ